MPRFFVTANDIDNTAESPTIVIRGDDAAHISRVLRMKCGDPVTVCDMAGVEYDTVIRETGGVVLLEVVGQRKSVNEPPYRAIVYQALVRADRFETVLQKSTELGAYAIVPVATSRCTVKIEPGSADARKKTERWQRIVYEAAKQCGRGIIPEVMPVVPYAEAVKMAASAALPLFCYEGDSTEPLPRYLDITAKPETISIMIGPEGGYTIDEAESASRHGMKMTGLGHRILRTETAPMFVLSCLACKYEL